MGLFAMFDKQRCSTVGRSSGWKSCRSDGATPMRKRFRIQQQDKTTNTAAA
jgi:hypothetical protein